MSEPTRRAGALGVHSLDHFSLAVRKISLAEKFYGTFGLQLQNTSSGFGLHTAGDSQRWGIVTEGARKQLNYISFGAFADDFAALSERVEGTGIKLLDPPAGIDSDGVWFRDLHERLVEIRVAEKVSPNQKFSFENPSVAGGERGAPYRSAAPRVQPRRLSHILLFTLDVLKAVAFYQQVLGLRLSDRSDDGIAFLHGIHGSDHHLLAFAKSIAPGFHHCSWDVASINEIGLGALQMSDAGFDRGWGVGRHVLGSNYFYYVRDPWGSYSEYSADIDYIPADVDWQSGDHPAEDAIYLWGPAMPEDFIVNYEAIEI
jgi:catechol 2,3-dioxygenase-like lactoylglutathione lyase family enzyme